MATRDGEGWHKRHSEIDEEAGGSGSQRWPWRTAIDGKGGRQSHVGLELAAYFWRQREQSEMVEAGCKQQRWRLGRAGDDGERMWVEEACLDS